MLMSRFLYLAATLLVLSLNGAALWTLTQEGQAMMGLVPAALIVNAVAWPLALFATYRIGQVTAAGSRHVAKKTSPHHQPAASSKH